jgi:hypothetical protein
MLGPFGISQNGFTSEAEAGEAKKSGFTRLLAQFSTGLQNGFTLQYLDLCETGEAEAKISPAKQAGSPPFNSETFLQFLSASVIPDLSRTISLLKYNLFGKQFPVLFAVSLILSLYSAGDLLISVLPCFAGCKQM